jgi:hypothetical protein
LNVFSLNVSRTGAPRLGPGTSTMCSQIWNEPALSLL